MTAETIGVYIHAEPETPTMPEVTGSSLNGCNKKKQSKKQTNKKKTTKE